MLRLAITIAIAAANFMPANLAQAAERKLLIGGFKNIIVEDDIAVTLTTGKAPKARVSGDKKDLSRVLVRRNGTNLVIKLSNNRTRNNGRVASEPLELTIQTRDLHNVTIRGNGAFTADTLTNPRTARILVAGNGQVQIGNLRTDRLNASIIGNGKIEIGEGQVNTGNLEVLGGGIMDAGDVVFTNVDIAQQGSGDTTVNAKKQASITNDGRGKITVGGTASCLIKKAGSATINCPAYAD